MANRPYSGATMNETGFDLLGLGVSTIDDLLLVEKFPRPNEKMPLIDMVRQGGGLTATALVAAARMGCKCGMVITLGDNELANFLRDALVREGITLIEDRSDPAIKPYHSVIITEKGTGERSILWSRDRVKAPRIDEKTMQLAAASRCLFVDHVFASEILDITRFARSRGVPVVGDYERHEPASEELMHSTNHLILPLAFARKAVEEPNAAPERTVGRLLDLYSADFACVTDSERGCWYAMRDQGGEVFHRPAYAVANMIDSTGCGDVFHGVYAAGLAAGLPPDERIRRASAAAAIKAGKRGAQAGAPTTAELEAFLATNPPLAK